ncbi:MAG: FAD-binding protein [Geminicoccaceae bacterium]|nr:FAD-binding protein [Geminicoccaceae bacterium]
MLSRTSRQGSAVPAAAFGALASLLGDRLSESNAEREHHSRGEGLPDAGLPDIVVYPESSEEVAAIAGICNTHRLPMIPFGAGSSLEGQVAAVAGGVSIDMQRMNRVLSVSQASLDCRVEAGLTRIELNDHLRDTGLFFPLDPGANATLGGMAATRASGTNAVGYGTMRDVTLGLTVVTPDGRIIRTGSRARKSATGYDLTRLYVGSEGTLGIITELQLRLAGQPEAIVTAVTQFPDLTAAVETASFALQMGLRMVRMELLDEAQMDACIRYSGLESMQPVPSLFVEFHGTSVSAREQAELFRELAADQGSLSFDEAHEAEDRTRLWKARHACYQAVLALAPGKRNMGTDACVPIEHLVECIVETQADIRESGLVAPIVGHVGDGNFHLGILFDPLDTDERARAEALAERVSLRAIRFGGSCSGEHGVGLHKTRYLDLEHGDGIEIMRSIKAALDPLGLMNPGKLIPEPVPG